MTMSKSLLLMPSCHPVLMFHVISSLKVQNLVLRLARARAKQQEEKKRGLQHLVTQNLHTFDTTLENTTQEVLEAINDMNDRALADLVNGFHGQLYDDVYSLVVMCVFVFSFVCDCCHPSCPFL